MKSLTQVQPRTDVATLSGDATNQYIISQAGSYYLTGNITGVSGKNGINISATNVTLDLNGFTMNGTGGLNGSGIVVSGSAAIHNGIVAGWGGAGIDASSSRYSVFEQLLIHDGKGAGISAQDSCTVRNCKVDNNGGGVGPDFVGADGISVRNFCLVIGNDCPSNGSQLGTPAGSGIHVTGSGNRIESNSLSNNRVNGIQVDSINVKNVIIKNNASNQSVNYSNTAGNNDYGPFGAPGTATNPFTNFQ